MAVWNYKILGSDSSLDFYNTLNEVIFNYLGLTEELRKKKNIFSLNDLTKDYVIQVKDSLEYCLPILTEEAENFKRLTDEPCNPFCILSFILIKNDLKFPIELIEKVKSEIKNTLETKGIVNEYKKEIKKFDNVVENYLNNKLTEKMLKSIEPRSLIEEIFRAMNK